MCHVDLMYHVAETRHDTAKTKQILETTGLQTLEKIRRVRIRKICNLDKANAKCNRKKLGLGSKEYGNISTRKMANDKLVKMVSNGRPAGRRFSGEPRRGWIE